ncbi:HTTM domain-containing protein [Flavobacterium sp.]|uniref:HTTM domain-containing protein n=1 Tax=Flavobacterium sp. TaxID=239 RepID=UPI0037C0D4A9
MYFLSDNIDSEVLNKYSVFSLKFHLCLVYFFSAVGKISTLLWYNGLANYYVLNNERFMLFELPEYLLTNSVFITLTTYSVIFWELTFPFFVLIKGTKKWMLLVALIFHFFVFNYMMLYNFQFLFMLILVVFLTDFELIRIYVFLKKKFYGIFRLGFRRRFLYK